MPSRLGLGACLLLSAFGQCLGDAAAVERFREYLRLRTAQPTPDYEAAATFLTQQGRDIGHVQHTPFWCLCDRLAYRADRGFASVTDFTWRCCAMHRTSRSS